MLHSLKNIFRKEKTLNAQTDEFASCRAGDEIFLYSKPGRYKVVATSEDGFIITCKRWRHTRPKEDRTQKHLWTDFKRKAY